MTKTIEEQFEFILIGIDEVEDEHVLGWWETSTGAAFGAKKKEELRLLIQAAEKAKVEEVIEEIELLGKLNEAATEGGSIFTDLATFLRTKFPKTPEE